MKRITIASICLLSIINPAFAYQKDTLAVEFQSDRAILKGQLIVPQKNNSKVPAVIFLPGSGGNSSYASDYKKFLEFFLLNPFANEEVAFMFFDKRGVRESEGNWYKTDFLQRAKDVKHAAEYLKSVPQIDEERIYVIGHSQGGWIVQICLSEYPDLFAGGVSMAGPTFNVRKQLINDYQSGFICNEKLDAESALKKAKRRVGRDLTIVTILPLKQDWKQLKLIRKFDPADYLVKIKKPLLLLFAENDRLVSPAWGMEHLNAIFPAGIPNEFTIHISQGENHSFQTSPLCYKGKWSELKFSESTREVIHDWLNTLLVTF